MCFVPILCVAGREVREICDSSGYQDGAYFVYYSGWGNWPVVGSFTRSPFCLYMCNSLHSIHFRGSSDPCSMLFMISVTGFVGAFRSILYASPCMPSLPCALLVLRSIIAVFISFLRSPLRARHIFGHVGTYVFLAVRLPIYLLDSGECLRFVGGASCVIVDPISPLFFRYALCLGMLLVGFSEVLAGPCFPSLHYFIVVLCASSVFLE